MSDAAVLDARRGEATFGVCLPTAKPTMPTEPDARKSSTRHVGSENNEMPTM